MTDLDLREAERSDAIARSGDTARILSMRLHAGLLKIEQLWLWAYCGLAAAREVLSECSACVTLKGNSGYVAPCLACGALLESKTRSSRNLGNWPLADWATGLPALALPYTVRKACESAGPKHSDSVFCPDCDGTGTVEREIGPQHLAVTACIGVARTMLHRLEDDRNECLSCLHERSGCPYHDSFPWGEIEDAIKAAERWRDDSTPENRYAVHALCSGTIIWPAAESWWRQLSNLIYPNVHQLEVCVVEALTSAKHIDVRLAVLRAIIKDNK